MFCGVAAFRERLVKYMFNMNHKKTRRIVSAVIIAFLIIAMVLPMLSYLVY